MNSRLLYHKFLPSVNDLHYIAPGSQICSRYRATDAASNLPESCAEGAGTRTTSSRSTRRRSIHKCLAPHAPTSPGARHLHRTLGMGTRTTSTRSTHRRSTRKCLAPSAPMRPRCQALTACPRHRDPHHKHSVHTQALHSQVPDTFRADEPRCQALTPCPQRGEPHQNHRSTH